MRGMERSLLLGALGWPEKSNIEGAARWSKASEDLLTSLSYRVSQDATRVSASEDLEGCDEDFNALSRPLLMAEFQINARGRMQLVKYVKNGVAVALDESTQPEALETFAQAKAGFPNKPKLALLGTFGSEPAAAAGAKL